MSGGVRHWEAVWTRGADPDRSWHQDDPQPSLDLVRRHAPRAGAPLVDVGAGTSRLADALLADGWTDLTLVDVAPAALDATRVRLGASRGEVRCLVADVADWSPPRRWVVWHDRAVLHFMVTSAALDGYLAALRAGTAPGAAVILGTFAPDGPERCSGLPVRRWASADLAAALGPDFALVGSRPHLHRTPAGKTQSFVFTVLRREGG